MAVELYFEKELSDVVFDVDSLDEWKSLVKELGVEGQEKLSKGKNSPIPFPFMNTKLTNIVNILCPASIEFTKYSKTAIPLDVLRQAAFCVREKYFQKIYVYYDDRSPDPFLVGTLGTINAVYGGDWLKDDKNSYLKFNTYEELNAFWEANAEIYPDTNRRSSYLNEKDKYLIARWGDHLKSMAELTQMAIDRCIEEKSQTLRADIAKLTEKLNLIKTNAPLFVNGVINEYELKGAY